MDSDEGKLFIGGISWETDENKLKEYFQAFGEVRETVIMRDRATGRARGFGFVVFADPSIADRVLLEKHTIDGRMVEAKKAVPRDEQQNLPRSSVTSGMPGPGGQTRTKKIFVGGLASTVTEQDFRKYFEQFGTITDVVVMYDHATQRPRGFGFISFDTEEAVDNVLQKSFHELNEKMVEVKRAVPKEMSGARSPSSGGGFPGSMAGRGGYGGYGQGYSSSVPGGYVGRPDGRFGPTAGRGGYPAYGAGGYAPGYGAGYGSMNGYGSSGYGGAAGYGAAVPGYSSGYGGAGYGGAGAGYAAASAGRNAWANSTPGYGAGAGSGGYPGGSGGYGTAVWGPGGATGQTGNTTGYSSYGYSQNEGNYVSNAGAYGARGTAGYNSPGTVGGAGSYTGYADGYGSTGYSDNTWRSGNSDSYNVAGGNGAVAGGSYGVGGSAAVDGPTNGQGSYGGYNVPGRQTQRGVAA